MDETDNFDLYAGLTTAQRTTIFGKCIIDDEEFQNIFLAKCEDFKLRYTEKLFQRFLKHQTKKSFYKIFEMNSCSLGPKASSVVAETIYNHPNIRTISLSGNNFGDFGAFSMADLILQSQHIIALDLSSNSLSDKGGTAIFQALAKNKSLISLKIGSSSGVSRNSFGSETMSNAEYMLRENKVLEELDMSMTEINADNIQCLANGLRVNNTLQVLQLANNNIQTRGTAAILSAAVGSNLRELCLASNHLKDDVSSVFADFLSRSKTIQSLDLSGNSLTSRFTTAIGKALEGECSLEDLTLSNNPIGGKGIAALGSAIAVNEKLRSLTFVQCKIDGAGFSSFCQQFEKNASIVKINFGHNPIRDEGAISFANVLKIHPTLKDVDLELCEIGDDGAKALFPALADSPNCDRFSAKNNLIRDGNVIQNSIQDDQKLLYLNIEYNDIDFKVFTEIQRIIKENVKFYQDNQKKRIEDAVIVMAEVENQLMDTRQSISEERQMIEYLIKTRKETEDSFEQTKIDSEKHAKDLEEELQSVINMATEKMNGYREEQDQIQQKINVLESEISALTGKLDREQANYQRECKQLKAIEKGLVDITAESATEEQNWKNQLEAAKMKYRDMRSMLEGSYQAEMMRKDGEDALQGEVQEGEAKSGKASKKKGKAKGKKKASANKSEAQSAANKSEMPSAMQSKKSMPTTDSPSATQSKTELPQPPELSSEVNENQNENVAQDNEESNADAPAPAIKEPESQPKKSGRRKGKAKK